MARGKSQGIQSKNNREVGVRTGNSKGKPANPGAIAQLGEKVGSHITDRRSSSNYSGEKFWVGDSLNTKIPFGNEVSLNVGAGGVGKGYKQYGQAGSQGCYGSNPGSPRTVPGKGKDSLIDSFGPSYRGSGRG